MLSLIFSLYSFLFVVYLNQRFVNTGEKYLIVMIEVEKQILFATARPENTTRINVTSFIQDVHNLHFIRVKHKIKRKKRSKSHAIGHRRLDRLRRICLKRWRNRCFSRKRCSICFTWGFRSVIEFFNDWISLLKRSRSTVKLSIFFFPKATIDFVKSIERISFNVQRFRHVGQTEKRIDSF